MTAIGVQSLPYATPNRTWLVEDHGTEVMPGLPLDLALFNQAQHYPNGFIPDGTVLGLKTSTGKYGPYLGSASDGRQTAVAITFNVVPAFQLGTGTLNTNVTVACLIHGFVNAANLPFTSGNAALGGYLDTAAQTALRNIIFVPSVA